MGDDGDSMETSAKRKRAAYGCAFLLNPSSSKAKEGSLRYLLAFCDFISFFCFNLSDSLKLPSSTGSPGVFLFLGGAAFFLFLLHVFVKRKDKQCALHCAFAWLHSTFCPAARATICVSSVKQTSGEKFSHKNMCGREEMPLFFGWGWPRLFFFLLFFALSLHANTLWIVVEKTVITALWKSLRPCWFCFGGSKILMVIVAPGTNLRIWSRTTAGRKVVSGPGKILKQEITDPPVPSNTCAYFPIFHSYA